MKISRSQLLLCFLSVNFTSPTQGTATCTTQTKHTEPSTTTGTFTLKQFDFLMPPKKKKKEISSIQTLGLFIKEILVAFALIGFGVVLYAYADDIGAWFGNMVQEAFNSIFGQPQN